MKTETGKQDCNNTGFQTGGVLAISISHLIHDIYSSFLSPLLPLFIEKLSLSLARAGFLTTIMQIPSLMNPYIGLFADRISVRWFIIIAPALTAISMSLIGLSTSYGMLLILLFITGISVAIFHVPSPVMISRLSGTRTGRGMSFYMTGGELARTLGPLIAVGAVSWFGLEGIWPLMVFGIITSIWLYVKFKGFPVHVNHHQNITITQTWKETRSVLLPLSAILTARGFMHASMTAFLPTFVMNETDNLMMAGTALTLFEASGVVGVLSVGSLSDHLGRRNMLLVSLVSAPLCFLLFSFTGGWIRILALVATGFTVLSTTPVMLAQVQELPASSPSAANGLFMMISFMARSAIVVLVGFVADNIGLHATYILSAFLGMLGIPFIFMLPRKNQ